MNYTVLTTVLITGIVAASAFIIGVEKTPDVIVGANAGPESTHEYQCVGGVCTYYKVGVCNSATTTIFAVRNPFNATSTATVLAIEGVGNATTTTFEVGTSTKATGLAAADVSGTLIVNASVATTSGFYTASGIQSGASGSYLSPGTGSARSVVLGPTQYIAGFATTTATGAGAAGFTGGFTSCTYTIEFTR